MATINDYENDTQINDEDKLLSSDGRIGPDLGKTKNIRVEDLKEFIKADTVTAVNEDKNFVFSQIAASDVWIANHNLGKFPAVTVVDSAGTEVIGTIEHINTNQVRISFSVPFGGKAYFN